MTSGELVMHGPSEFGVEMTVINPGRHKELGFFKFQRSD
jgi:hypothetical protein